MTREQLEKLAKQSAKERKARQQITTEEAIERAKQLDKERAARRHERKTPTKEEKVQETIKKMLEYKEQPQQEEEKPKKVKKDPDAWDVKIGDPIEYFDPTLSYELTGYRPINETEGLDFDPKPFTVAADTYRETGKYTSLLPGTFAHRAFWINEFNKCKYGVTIGRYRLTGEHYFFLNYYRLPSVLGKKDAANAQEENFPAFMAKQYEMAHYIELASKLNKDALLFKCRGIGFSEWLASCADHSYTFFKGARNIITASSDSYVTNALSKAWQELDFLNTCTQGGFRRVRMKVDTSFKKRASKVDKDKNEVGWKSEIEGIICDNPRKLRGPRTRRLFFDEVGSFPGLVDAYVQATALVDILGERVGIRILGGTGGDQGPQLEGLSKMFYNPEDYDILPYKNYYSRTGELAYTGFFIPSYEMWFGPLSNPGFDHRGVVDTKRAKKWYQDNWDKIKDPHVLLKKKAEYCFTPEDALALEGSGVFNTEKLTEQQINIQQLKTVEPPRKIKLTWDYNKEIGGVDRNSMPKAQFTNEGKIQITELPMTDDNGIPFQNLYLVGIDAIDQDKSTSTGQTDVSKFCIVVLRRMVGLKPPKIVAIYLERPSDVREAYDNALKLCQFYNAKALVEATRIGVITHFKNNNKQSYLIRRPSSTITSRKQNKAQYGTPAPTAIIEHQIELIQEYVEDFYDQIDYLEVIDQLIRYSFENKRKFDIVAAFGLALLANEDMQGKVPKIENGSNKKLQNIGFYTNEYGQKVFGVIKQTEQSTMKYGWFRETN